MARRTRIAKGKSVETIRHEEATRANIPTAEYQSLMREEEASPVRVAYQRRNRDLDPQLVWRGKDEQDWSDLVIYPPRRTTFAVAVLSMIASIILPFMLWLTGGLTLTVATLASIGLVGLTAFALRRHLIRQVPSLGI